MATINLFLQSTKNPAVIYIRLRDGRTLDIKAKTNFHIAPANWDKVEQKPIKKLLKDVYFANLDTDLSTLKNELLKDYNNSKGTKIVDALWLKNFINPPQVTKRYPEKLVDYIDTYIEFKRTDVEKSTISKWRVIQSLIKRYQKYTNSILYIRDIDSRFKVDFENYCTRANYALNTTARNIRTIKTFCKHAKANGVDTHFQLESIKVKHHKVDSIYLTPKEIESIENIKSEDLTNGLENDRDWLLISCYCGQRVSDFLRFDKSMIRHEKNKNGTLKPLIEFTQVKTNTIMTVPLHSKIMEILKKYNGNFPRKISNQKYNDNIKKVCLAAKIQEPTKGIRFNSVTKQKEEKTYEKWELVASHIGRRSFASNNYGIIPTSFLKYVTGHSTETMFLTYIGKSNKDIAMELTNYF